MTTLIIQLIVSRTTLMSNILHIYPISVPKALLAISLALPLLLVMEIFKLIIRKKWK